MILLIFFSRYRLRFGFLISLFLTNLKFSSFVLLPFSTPTNIFKFMLNGSYLLCPDAHSSTSSWKILLKFPLYFPHSSPFSCFLLLHAQARQLAGEKELVRFTDLLLVFYRRQTSQQKITIGILLKA